MSARLNVLLFAFGHARRRCDSVAARRRHNLTGAFPIRPRKSWLRRSRTSAADTASLRGLIQRRRDRPGMHARQGRRAVGCLPSEDRDAVPGAGDDRGIQRGGVANCRGIAGFSVLLGDLENNEAGGADGSPAERTSYCDGAVLHRRRGESSRRESLRSLAAVAECARSAAVRRVRSAWMMGTINLQSVETADANNCSARSDRLAARGSTAPVGGRIDSLSERGLQGGQVQGRIST